MEQIINQILSVLKGIWKYRFYAVIAAWLFAIVGWGVVHNLPDNYKASARVFVDTQGILKPLLSSMTAIPDVEQQVAIMSRTLISRPNIERVLGMVDLDHKANTPAEKEKLINDMISQIKIAGTTQNNIYTISYSSENPTLAKDVVQSFLTIFVENSFGSKKEDSAKAIDFIDEQIKNYEEKLTEAENKLRDFKIKNIGLFFQDGDNGASKLAGVAESLSQAKLELLEAEQARNAIKRQIEGELPSQKDGPNRAVPVNSETVARIQELYKNLDSLRMQYTEQHPDVVATKRLINQLEERSKQEVTTPKADPGIGYSPMMQQLKVSLSEAEAKVAVMSARVQEYAARQVKLKDLTTSAPEIEKEYAQLNRDYGIYKENYQKLVASREAARLSGDLSATTEMMSFRVIDPPTVPSKPDSPNRLALNSVVLLAALLAGLTIAFASSKMRPTFMDAITLREETSLPILGMVSMNWTQNQKLQQKKHIYVVAGSFLLLLSLYGAVMAATLFNIL